MAAENITPFFDTEKEHRQMNVVAFMSGSGTNVIKILQYQRRLEQDGGESPFSVSAVFSDRKEGSNAEKIAKDFGINYLFWCDIDKWYRQEGRDFKGKNDKDIPKNLRVKLRMAYDMGTVSCLKEFKIGIQKSIEVIALCGYMSFLTEPILGYALCVNVHPADLRIQTPDGKRKYTGDNAVRDAIAAGEPTIRSSVHIATTEVDYGPLMMVSEPLHVITSSLVEEKEVINPNRFTLKQMVDDAPAMLQKVADYNQGRLKEKGDWVIFPKTLEMMARGMFGKDGEGKVYHKNDEGVWTPGEVVLG